MRVILYRTLNGKEPFTEWLDNLHDKTAQIRIRQRIRRLELGNLGDCKPLGEGVYELRFFFGSGYRVYFGLEGRMLILLLCGGDKSSQKRDIEKAKTYWKAHKEHTA